MYQLIHDSINNNTSVWIITEGKDDNDYYVNTFIEVLKKKFGSEL